ncbi:hypothetical protein ACFQGT_10665 [Natrialbaceae archaeon GCM10025810]|uniref:hypothetical protein n=1 Tax=Halovalidus salilacus TaxID=3075124 RepID=UPI0036090782
MTARTVGTIDELFARERREDRPALVDGTGRGYDAHWLYTTAWKAGNFLRHSGVRRGVTVGVVGEGPLALLAFFGTTLLEGTTRFDPPPDMTDDERFRALVAPIDRLDSYELPPGAQRVGYGGKPEAPDVHHFDAGLWSENPSFPPLDVDPDTIALEDDRGRYGHADLLEAALAVVDDAALERGDRVAIRSPLSDARTIAGGVIAPLLADAVTVLPSDGDEPTPTEEVDAVVGGSDERDAETVDDAGDTPVVDLESIPLDPR